MDAKTVKKHKTLEMVGAIIVCICAPILHFTFEWSGENFLVGLFSATNESVWEHTKLIYYPMLIFSIIEFFILKPDFKRFFAAKTAALLFVSIATISFFYTYTGIFGIELLALDIICTFAWSILGFVISFKLYYSHFKLEKYFYIFCILFAGQFVVQVLFTPLAPEIPLFEDHN